MDGNTLVRPAVEIDLAALLSNARFMRSRLRGKAELHAVVKADAYGHGAVAVTSALARARLAERAVVATLEEAAAIAHCGLPVTVLRPVDLELQCGQLEPIELALRAGWTLTVESPAAACALADLAGRRGTRASLQLMLDTGISRCGVDANTFGLLLRQIAAKPVLRLKSIATHFATQDSACGQFTREQLARFVRTTEPALQSRPVPPQRIAAASGATLGVPQSHLDAVRLGASLYGIDPFHSPSPDRTLRPVMRWVAPLLATRSIEPGQTVGYGQTWMARRPSRVGFVPIGYHDGYPRLASNKGRVVVRGRPVPIVGRVSMDSVMIDLTDLPALPVGESVTLLDPDPTSPASMYALAADSGTTAYEIVARTGPRVPRRYVNDLRPEVVISLPGAEPAPRLSRQSA